MFSKSIPLGLLALPISLAQALVPIHSPRHGKPLGARDLSLQQLAFIPSNRLSTQYMHEDLGPNYIINIAHTHDSLRYVLLDDLESCTSSLQCEHNFIDESVPSTMHVTFTDEASLKLAKHHWCTDTSIIFITAAPACDPTGERTYYHSTSIESSASDPLSLFITAAKVRDLQSSNPPGGRTTISGVPVSPSHYRTSPIRKRDNHPFSSTVDLNQQFDQPRQEFFNADDFGVTCIDCSMSGQVMPSFSVDLSDDATNTDTHTLGSGSNNTNDTSADVADLANLITGASVGAAVTEPIDMAMTFEVVTREKVEVQCSIPPGPGCGVTVTFPGGSVAFMPLGGPLKSFKVGNFQFGLTWQYGVEFDVSLSGEVNV